MAQNYFHVVGFVQSLRNLMQDGVSPYRYTDVQVIDALSRACMEAQRIRPDIFLDLKYTRPLRKGDIDDGAPSLYSTNDIVYQNDGITYVPGEGTLVPVPGKYIQPFCWYMSGYLQFYDMADTQDQRAQAFLTKFQQELMTTTAA